MTQKTLSGLLLIVIVTLISYKAYSSNKAVKASLDISYTEGLTKEPAKGNLNSHSMPLSPLRPAKESHGKTHTPQMDELAHMHKFHKERVKKIKKHHSKFWILSKLILILCHISILIIAYLHATH